MSLLDSTPSNYAQHNIRVLVFEVLIISYGNQKHAYLLMEYAKVRRDPTAFMSRVEKSHGFGKPSKLLARSNFKLPILGDGDIAENLDEQPVFPILIRCQCLYSQLSQIELDAGEASTAFPVDLSVKLARRFRLSHKEK